MKASNNVFIKTILFLLLLSTAPFYYAYAKEKNVLGWVEYVVVEPGGIKLKAKLDTGAKTSSIRAKILKEYEKDGESWLTYEISSGKSSKAASAVIDSKVERWVRIKKKSEKGGFIRRPVVKLGFCLGEKFIVGEVNLSPRSGFLYPALVGRNMLRKHTLIDTHNTLTTKPTCNEKKLP